MRSGEETSPVAPPLERRAGEDSQLSRAQEKLLFSRAWGSFYVQNAPEISLRS